jgi:hypothetical protein
MTTLASLLKTRLQEMTAEVEAAKQAAETATTHYLSLKSQAEAYQVALNTELNQHPGKKIPTQKPHENPPPLSSEGSPVRQAVLKLFWTEKRALRAKVVHSKLKGSGFSKKSIWRMLSRLEERGVLRRLGYGMYELKNGEIKTSATS